MPDEYRILPLTELIDPPIVLRPVDRKSLEFLQLRDSIAKYGVLNSICVRPSRREPGKYDKVDGLWRAAAAEEARLHGIPSIVKDLTDSEVLAIQIVANSQRPQTAPSDFARQIRRIMQEKEGMSQADLCQLLHKSSHWIRRMLGLARLTRCPSLSKAVDRGEMSLEVAYWLSRLPHKMWDQFATDAKTLDLVEFRALTQTFLRQHRAALITGDLQQFYGDDVEIRPRLRGLRELLPEIERPQEGSLRLVNENCQSAMDGWLCALKWVVHLDPDSVERFRTRIRQRLRSQVLKRYRERKALE